MEPPAATHKIIVNGNDISINSSATLIDLLQHLELEASMVAIEQNSEIVPRSEFSTRRLCAGDRLEIVHFVGGG